MHWTGSSKRDFRTERSASGRLYDTTWVWKVCETQRVVETLTGTTPRKNTGKNAVTQRNLIKTDNLLKEGKNMSNNKVP